MTEHDIEQRARAKMNRSKWVYWFPPHSWKRERDIFGVFDVVALHSGKFIFIQLTSIQHISDREKKILAWEKNNGQELPAGSAEVWAWDERKSAFIVREICK